MEIVYFAEQNGAGKISNPMAIAAVYALVMNASNPSAWCVYMLACGDGSLYTGCTNRLAARIRLHNAGKGAKYTAGRLPVRLVYAEPAASRGAALRRERQLKSFSRQRKLALAASWQPSEDDADDR